MNELAKMKFQASQTNENGGAQFSSLNGLRFVFTVVSTSQVNEKKHHCILHLKLGA
jgi:hypothetical protein